jgi:very-long-chain (3R)-3-hydroxyacyl-CoA dehydratase
MAAATSSSPPPKLGIKELYLILYNIANCLGWLWVLLLTLASLVKDIPNDGLVHALANVYFAAGLSTTLFYTQSAALLEIVHAAIGLVRSPVLVTAMQVGSRIVALVAVVLSPHAQGMSRSFDLV